MAADTAIHDRLAVDHQARRQGREVKVTPIRANRADDEAAVGHEIGRPLDDRDRGGVAEAGVDDLHSHESRNALFDLRAAVSSFAGRQIPVTAEGDLGLDPKRRH